MNGTETGKEKVRKICEILRKETLEPAKREAEKALDDARLHAEEIVKEAKHRAEEILSNARDEIDRQKNVFQTSLNQSCKQAIESLKQQIEEKLFNPELERLITEQMKEPKVIQKIIASVIQALEKEGIDADLSVYIPAAISANEINALLGEKILSKLREKSVLLGGMTGGVEVKLKKNHVSIDITDRTLRELVANYIRRDFREMLFG